MDTESAAPSPITQSSSAEVHPQQALWIYEIWTEYRDVFKELVAHTIIFAFLILTLTASHFVLEKLNYPQSREDLLDKIHFYSHVIILVIFVIGSIFKVIAFEYRGLRK